jgi:hypothetical protein
MSQATEKNGERTYGECRKEATQRHGGREAWNLPPHSFWRLKVQPSKIWKMWQVCWKGKLEPIKEVLRCQEEIELCPKDDIEERNMMEVHFRNINLVN